MQNLTNAVIENAQKAVAARAGFVAQKLQETFPGDMFWVEISNLFYAAYQNPIRTTAEMLPAPVIETYAGTGGWLCYGPPKSPSIPSDYEGALDDMWVRDACAQYHAYLGIFAGGWKQPEADQLRDLGYVIEGIVRTCADFLTRPGNITAHAFDRSGEAKQTDYEPDSLAYLIFLAWSYEQASGSSAHLDEYFWKAAAATIQVLGDGSNLYTFEDGSALTLTPYRPSDDQAQRNFNIPINAFCAVAMEKLADLALRYGNDPSLTKAAGDLGAALRSGVETRGIADYLSYGRIYIYETNAGFSQRTIPKKDSKCFIPPGDTPVFMDDANIPSLLSLPYLGFCDVGDPTYAATRRFLLSPDNPYYFTGTDGEVQYAGIGGCHTQQFGGLAKPIWPMAITMRGLTSTSDTEKMDALQMLRAASLPDWSDLPYGGGCNEDLSQTYPAGGYIHESFEADSATSYTRGWFAWANALFGEWIDTMVREGTLPS